MSSIVTGITVTLLFESLTLSLYYHQCFRSSHFCNRFWDTSVMVGNGSKHTIIKVVINETSCLSGNLNC